MQVFLIAAITADGFIGRHQAHLADWTSPEDKKRFVTLTKQAGVMVMGANTFATIGRALPGRRSIVYTHHPEKISVDGVETTSESPRELIKRLQKEGANGVAICGGASIYDLFMEAGVVTHLYLTIEPVLFGNGVPLLKTTMSAKLALEKVEQPNQNTLFVDYRVE